MPNSFLDSVNADLAQVFRDLDLEVSSETCVGLTGGRSNRACLLRRAFQGRDVVAKLFPVHSDNPLFPNDGAAELSALRHLAGTGLAPTPIGGRNTKTGFCLAYLHVPGPVAACAPQDVGRYLARLHGCPAPNGVRRIPAGADGVRRSAAKVAARVAASLLPPLPEIAEPIGPARSCFLHGDLVPSNIVTSGSGLVAIDWQCPAQGDPCEDIAVFLSPAMQVLYGGRPLDDGEQRAFFSGYGSPETEARYRMLASLFHWRMAAYCAWKAEKGEVDYAKAMQLELAAFQKSANP